MSSDFDKGADFVRLTAEARKHPERFETSPDAKRRIDRAWAVEELLRDNQLIEPIKVLINDAPGFHYVVSLILDAADEVEKDKAA